ncbi:SIMPL domain-containing protein [Patescibacteria group bacterium]|nr:SIMPL domain-containing protein [Patescibacteria group bacterium]MCL5010470.1 SIMPL domain-containing protein [Patescibacteria group bacterium]
MRRFYQEFKTPVVTIAVLFVAFFLYTRLAGPIPFFIRSVQTAKTDLFSARGEGTAGAVPDTAVVDLGISQTSATVSEAQSRTNGVSGKIIKDIKKLGIAPEDIKTVNYSLYPNYPPVYQSMIPVRGGGNIAGYTVSENLEIKVTPIDKVNKVIDVAVSDGANLVGGISFAFSKGLEKALEDKAMRQAVANAKEKARNLSSASGINLGKIVNVVQTSNMPRPFPMMGGAYNSAGQRGAPQTNVTPGQNTVRVSVVIYYETY